MKIISVKSIHRWQSVIQTSYDIVKAHGEDPDSYREKVETKENEGSAFIIHLPLAWHLTEMNFKIILNKFLSSTLLIATALSVPIYPEFRHTQ